MITFDFVITGLIYRQNSPSGQDQTAYVHTAYDMWCDFPSLIYYRCSWSSIIYGTYIDSPSENDKCLQKREKLLKITQEFTKNLRTSFFVNKVFIDEFVFCMKHFKITFHEMSYYLQNLLKHSMFVQNLLNRFFFTFSGFSKCMINSWLFWIRSPML